MWTFRFLTICFFINTSKFHSSKNVFQSNGSFKSKGGDAATDNYLSWFFSWLAGVYCGPIVNQVGQIVCGPLEKMAQSCEIGMIKQTVRFQQVNLFQTLIEGSSRVYREIETWKKSDYIERSWERIGGNVKPINPFFQLLYSLLGIVKICLLWLGRGIWKMRLLL